MAEDTESGDSETATEVEVSEKTLKFKISTEGNISSGRKSYPGSRKGSRERGQHLNCYEVARAMQGEKDRRKFIHGGLSFDQKTLMGKKLSFDTTELFDEHAKRYFRQYNKKVSIDSISPDDVDKTNHFSASPNLEDNRIIKQADAESRPCDAFVIKQNNISAKIMTDVCENSLIKDENEEESAEVGTKIDVISKTKVITSETLSKSCKLDKISVDKSNKLVQGDTTDSRPEEKPSPNGNRSLLTRLRQFTDRLGLTIDKDSNSKFMKHMKFHSPSFKNNNGTRMTLPLRNKKKQEDPCCKTEPVVVTDEKRASTLPKISRFSFGGKKTWKQRLLGRDRTSSSLDHIPPPSTPVSLKASTSYSEANSRIATPRKDLEPEQTDTPESVGPFEPDPKVLNSSIELM